VTNKDFGVVGGDAPLSPSCTNQSFSETCKLTHLFSSFASPRALLPTIEKEYQSFEKDPLNYCTVRIIDDNLYHWQCTMIGPQDTPYAGGIFQLKIEFPSQYPFKPPTVLFLTKVYHPSIETKSGKICADVMNEGWGPTLNVRHCLALIYGMLQTPDSDHPLEEEIATLLRQDPKKFEEQARKYRDEYAK
jgi:ubiquitin-conjugating enzyme E2 D